MNNVSVYDDFFAGFGVGSGSFATLDENWPVCGGFGLPRILILLFAIGYFVTRNDYTPEISKEFRKRRRLLDIQNARKALMEKPTA